VEGSDVGDEVGDMLGEKDGTLDGRIVKVGISVGRFVGVTVGNKVLVLFFDDLLPFPLEDFEFLLLSVLRPCICLSPSLPPTRRIRLWLRSPCAADGIGTPIARMMQVRIKCFIITLNIYPFNRVL